jgi:putative FmdB family regulatory protein
LKEEGAMPIYEYKSKNGAYCKVCKNKFEVRQGIDDEPLTRCPECGAEIRRVFSRPFLGRRESLSNEGPLNYLEDEDDEIGLDEEPDEDEVWE